MKIRSGGYLIITIVLGCLTHLFSFTAGYSTVPSLREELVNFPPSSVQLTPAQAQMPVVIMTVPVVVGACDNLLIDLSSSWGHFGRPWTKVAWTVSSTSFNSADTNNSSSSSNRLADHVVDYLTKHFDLTTARVAVPSYLWRESFDVVLSLTVSLTNYHQQSLSDTRLVMVHSGWGNSGSSGDDLLASRYSIHLYNI